VEITVQPLDLPLVVLEVEVQRVTVQEPVVLQVKDTLEVMAQKEVITVEEEEEPEVLVAIHQQEQD
jgi:hypothetical protein